MNIKNIKSKLRLLKHLIFKSGNLTMGIDHFLVSFPSILLIAKMLNANSFDKNSISLLLFSTGVSNIVLYIITRLKVPIFVAPSFAFLGFITTTMDIGSNNITQAHLNVFLGCLISSCVFLLIALLYKLPKVRKYVKLTLPDALVGPLISLIGLNLLDTAIEDSGLKTNDFTVIFITIFTLSVIILSTTLKRHHLKKASILIGVVCGVILSYFLGQYHSIEKSNSIFIIPNINIINFLREINIREIEWLNILIAIVPATIVVFSENITKITLLEKIIRSEETSNKNDLAKFYQTSIWGHAISFFVSIGIGSIPNTVYAQNIALMEINNVESYSKNIIQNERKNNIAKYYNRLSAYPLILTSIIALICSFLSVFQDILSNIPKPVYGGMELFVFSIISAQGVQLLVDRKVDYKKITNQIITSATLLAGLSGISINLDIAEISGLSLGLLVGVSLNIIFKLLSYFGLINEKVKVIDVLEECISVFSKEKILKIQSDNIDSETLNEYIKGENRTDHVLIDANNIITSNIKIDDYMEIVISKDENDNVVLKINPYLDEFIEITNDYPKNAKREINSLVITYDERFSTHKLKSSLNKICSFQ